LIASTAAFKSEYAVTSMRTVYGLMLRTEVRSSTPVWPGMRWSVSKTAISCCSNRASPSRALLAVRIGKRWPSAALNTVRFAGSSST
jgi:hypothetical protein